MALTAKLYRTNKRLNSTLQPNPSTYATETMVLKDNTDAVHPSFEFNKGMAWSPSDYYNYMEVPGLGRNYFIRKWIWTSGIWIAECTCDVLGTYKSSILAMEKYVTRCGTRAYANLYLTDGAYPVSGETDHWTVATSLSWNHNWAAGWYVLGIVGTSSSTTAGSVEYWVLDAAQIKQLVNFMLSGLGSTDWTAASWKTEWERIMADPFQYIVSCMYFPFQPPLGPQAYLTFGYWTTTIQGYLLASPYLRQEYSLNCYLGSQQDVFGYVNAENIPDYIYMAPYSSYVMYFPPFGIIELDGMLAIHKQYIGIEIKTDFISGIAVASFYAYNGNDFNHFDRYLTCAEAQLGVQIQLTQNTSSLIQRVGSTASTFISALAGSALNPVAGISGAASILTSTALQSLNGSFEHHFNNGGISMMDGNVILHVYRRWPAQYYGPELGWPCCKPLILSNLTGYTQCADGTNTVAALEEEKEMIADHLANGFFIE